MEAMAREHLALHQWICLSLLHFVHAAHCFYLPSVAHQDFQNGNELKVKVNKLTSTKTQLPYYYYSLPYCHPEKIVDSAENLGEVLRGDCIKNSPYLFRMRAPQVCNIDVVKLLMQKLQNSSRKR